jgi:hypothetical protein
MSSAAPVRVTDWIMTASGAAFWPLEPRVEDVAIADIAHHLSHLCRFTGAVHTFYSVAQHSVLVCEELVIASPDRDKSTAGLYGLLHDASEAYLMDVPRPLKHAPEFEVYRAAEAHLQAVIYQAFGLDPHGEPALLKSIDRRLLRTEQRDLMPPPALQERRDDVPVLPLTIEPWPPDEARVRFLVCFHELTRNAVRSAR